MNVKQFIENYGNEVTSYKKYTNGVLKVKFANKNKIMWLKRIICEKMDMKVKASSQFGIYWFEPLDN